MIGEEIILFFFFNVYAGTRGKQLLQNNSNFFSEEERGYFKEQADVKTVNS